jgi:hypothetical protein
MFQLLHASLDLFYGFYAYQKKNSFIKQKRGEYGHVNEMRRKHIKKASSIFMDVVIALITNSRFMGLRLKKS